MAENQDFTNKLRSTWNDLKQNLPDKRAHLIFWPIVLIGAAADLWTKYAAFEFLDNRGTSVYPVIENFFYLVRAENPGAAFGIAAGQTTPLIVISIFASILILVIFFFGRLKSTLSCIALGMFTAGVFGNLYDRMFNEGRVRDFIDIIYWPGRHWPAFNIADVLLTVGVFLLLLATYITEKQDRKCDPQHK